MSAVYTMVLMLHSLVRWVAVIAGVVAVVMAFAGWFGNRRWTSSNERLNMLFTSFMDLNVLIGIFLAFILSPITRGAFQDMGAAMRDSTARFFVAEHWLLMIIALVLAHVGSSRAKKAADDKGKFKQTAIFFTIAMVLILLAIPWPFMATGAGRGWF
jgi:uncharacterized membrane protein